MPGRRGSGGWEWTGEREGMNGADWANSRLAWVVQCPATVAPSRHSDLFPTSPLRTHFHNSPQALPRACTLLGAYLGFGILFMAGVVTWWSISSGLVHPAARLVDRHAASGRQGSGLVGYSQLVRTYAGKVPAQLLNVFLLANTVGFSGETG